MNKLIKVLIFLLLFSVLFNTGTGAARPSELIQDQRLANLEINDTKQLQNNSYQQQNITTLFNIIGLLNNISGNISVPWIDVRNYGAIGDGINDDTLAIQNALDTKKRVFLPIGSFKISRPLELPDGVIFEGITQGGDMVDNVKSQILVDNNFVGDAIIRAKNRDDNSPDSWNVVQTRNIRITVIQNIPSPLSALDITGFRYSTFESIYLQGIGEDTTHTAIRIADDNLYRTSSKTSFFNIIKNIKASGGGGWGTMLNYSQIHGNANNNLIESIDGSVKRGLVLSSMGFSSGMIFKRIYLASTTGSNNCVVQDNVFPGESTFESIIGEGFDQRCNWIIYKTTSSYPYGGIGISTPLIMATGTGINSFMGTVAAGSLSSKSLSVPGNSFMTTPAFFGFGNYSNLYTNSERFELWVQEGATVIADATSSPIYTQTADLLDIQGSSYIRNDATFSNTNGRTFTFSVWAKAGTDGTSIFLALRDNNGQITYSASQLTQNWTRYSVTGTSSSDGTLIETRIWLTSGKNAYIWGGQLEEATSTGLYSYTDNIPITAEQTGIRLGINNYPVTSYFLTSNNAIIPTIKPSSPVNGNIYGNTTTKVMMWYYDGVWYYANGTIASLD